MTRKADSGGERGKVKFRILEFELDGSDASLQESLRSITTAMNRAAWGGVIGPAPGPARQLTGGAKPGPETKSETEPAAVADDRIVLAESDEATADNDVQPATRRRRYPVPKVLVDLDLTTRTSFREFVAGRELGSDNDRYLAVAAWLKEHRATDDVTADHIYTCYRHMDWAVPKDMGMALRKMASKNFQFFTKVKGVRGAYAVNHIGLDKVPGREQVNP